ncbi:MAG: hypothetical protein LBS74_05705 [Oscillospiraceae bacterium]|nr:hypothetical protein [Oscillospiraceae bacterium]
MYFSYSQINSPIVDIVLGCYIAFFVLWFVGLVIYSAVSKATWDKSIKAQSYLNAISLNLLIATMLLPLFAIPLIIGISIAFFFMHNKEVLRWGFKGYLGFPKEFNIDSNGYWVRDWYTYVDSLPKDLIDDYQKTLPPIETLKVKFAPFFFSTISLPIVLSIVLKLIIPLTPHAV